MLSGKRSGTRDGATTGERRQAAPPPDPTDVVAAAAAAMQILNGAAQSSDGLLRRLTRKGFDADTAAATVETMRGYGYVNDAALATSVARRRERNGYGRARIVADLRSRYIDADVVDATIDDLDSGGDVERAFEVGRRAWRPTDDAPGREKNRRRVAGMLQRRGYGGDIVSAVLRRLSAESGDDESI